MSWNALWLNRTYNFSLLWLLVLAEDWYKSHTCFFVSLCFCFLFLAIQVVLFFYVKNKYLTVFCCTCLKWDKWKQNFVKLLYLYKYNCILGSWKENSSKMESKIMARCTLFWSNIWTWRKRRCNWVKTYPDRSSR